jgi:hypothetical protein
MLLYTVKKVIVFHVLCSWDVTNQTLPGWEILKYSPPGRVLFVTFRRGTEKTITFFYAVCRYVEPACQATYVGGPVRQRYARVDYIPPGQGLRI